ncbi:MAG: DUF481 domain-containing protein [Woeseiaceae bacterium]|nr:DUF481 domain-containing protein [Woeseiaceae bacterium]
MRLFSIFAIALLWSNPLFAAEIHLKDGSVLYGSIVSLSDGDDLVLDTQYMDEVTIEWTAIRAIHNTEVIEVELFDGTRYFGEIAVADGELIIEGEEPVALSPERVFAIDEVSEGFWDSLGLYTDLGMNLVRGNNTVTQLSLGAGASYETRDHELSIDATSIINEQSDATDTRRATLNANYSYKFASSWLASGLYQFESDEQQGLDGRSVLGAAIGNRIINRRRHRVNLFTGLVVNAEDFESAPREESLEGLFGGAYRMRSQVDLDLSLYVFPNLEQSGRYRTQFDATLSIDLIADFDFKVTAYDRYDSEPPLGNDKHDSGITVGLSWSK